MEMGESKTLPTLVAPVWEQQTGEKALWFDRFTRYLVQGAGRSLRATYSMERAAKGVNKQQPSAVPGAWHQVYTTWQWRKRAEAWDEQKRSQLHAQEAEERIAMNKRHIREARVLRGLMNLQTNELEPIANPAVGLRAWQAGAEAERKARGVPSHIIELAQLSKEELKAKYQGLLAELAATLQQDGEAADDH